MKNPNKKKREEKKNVSYKRQKRCPYKIKFSIKGFTKIYKSFS